VVVYEEQQRLQKAATATGPPRMNTDTIFIIVVCLRLEKSEAESGGENVKFPS
jgi:hypothetical protein